MSKIILLPRPVENPSAKLLMRLKNISGKTPGEIKQAIRSGTPLFQVVIFGNDHAEVVNQMRGILDVLEEENLEYELFELEEEEAFVSREAEEMNGITREVFENISENF